MAQWRLRLALGRPTAVPPAVQPGTRLRLQAIPVARQMYVFVVRRGASARIACRFCSRASSRWPLIISVHSAASHPPFRWRGRRLASGNGGSLSGAPRILPALLRPSCEQLVAVEFTACGTPATDARRFLSHDGLVFKAAFNFTGHQPQPKKEIKLCRKTKRWN